MESLDLDFQIRNTIILDYYPGALNTQAFFGRSESGPKLMRLAS